MSRDDSLTEADRAKLAEAKTLMGQPGYAQDEAAQARVRSIFATIYPGQMATAHLGPTRGG